MGLFLLLMLPNPLSSDLQVLYGGAVGLGVLQGLEEGQGHGRVRDGGQSHHAAAQGRAQFLLRERNDGHLLTGPGHKALGSAAGAVGGILCHQHQPGVTGPGSGSRGFLPHLDAPGLPGKG